MKNELRQPGDPALWNDWQWQKRNSCTSLGELSEIFDFSPKTAEKLKRVSKIYPPLITPYYLSLAEEPKCTDPIVRQCVPSVDEIGTDPEGASEDPLHEKPNSPIPGLVHRYPDRVLVLLSTRCAVNCRHCFRKGMWRMGSGELSGRDITRILEYIAKRPGIREVILSGGDPLLVAPKVLKRVIAQFHALRGVEIVRIGTRLPVVLPQRFTQEFCAGLSSRGPVWIATHFNHPRELTAASRTAVGRLLSAGIPVVNQTVLLKGVNDSYETLRSLFTGLVRFRVKPYYLLHADPVKGAMHFRTGLARGLRLMERLEGNMSGLALPSFALDLPDGAGKIRMLPQRRCGKADSRTALLRSTEGGAMPYPL